MSFKDHKGAVFNAGALFDIPTGKYIPSTTQEFTGLEALDQKKHYYALHPVPKEGEYDLITSFTEHYETPHFDPTFNSTLAQWPLFEKYNIPKANEWFESLIRFGEEVLANDDGDHEQDIRVTKILEWARIEITEPNVYPFPEDLFTAQLEGTQFAPIIFDSLSPMEQALTGVHQFDQPKPVKKKKKRKGSNRTTASRNKSVGGSMMALLAKGTPVDPEQGIGLSGMLKRLERETKGFEERLKAQGLAIPDISKGETLESVNPGKDLTEFQ